MESATIPAPAQVVVWFQIHEPNSVIENENIPHYMYINVFGDNLSTL